MAGYLELNDDVLSQDMSNSSKDTSRLQAPSGTDISVLAILSLGAVVSGLGIFVIGGPATGKDWAFFAYLFMTLASAAFVGGLVEVLHWWCRCRYLTGSRSETLTAEERLF